MLVLRLKSDNVWYSYYALFVPFMSYFIIHSISHFIGVSLCMLYIYLFFHLRLLDIKRLDPGGVRSYIYFFYYVRPKVFTVSFKCHYDYYILIYFPVGYDSSNLFLCYMWYG